MDRRRLAIVIALSCVAFALAATGHGRQLRAEREAHGYLQMDKTSGWPLPLHEIWQADRVSLGVGSAVAAVAGVGAAVTTGAGVGVAALAAVLWAPTVGFAVAVGASALRLQSVPWSAAALLIVALGGLVGAMGLARRRR
jgi:hypothetical protein